MSSNFVADFVIRWLKSKFYTSQVQCLPVHEYIEVYPVSGQGVPTMAEDGLV